MTTFILCLMCALPMWAIEDHVMQATKPATHDSVPAQLHLSLQQAQDYAVKQNRSLRNASMDVQAAYAQRWQTIASMLPSLDASAQYTNYCGYSMTMGIMGQEMKINMPNSAAFNLTAAVGVNGAGIVGALMQTLAIDMRQIALEKSELDLRKSITTSYVSILVLNDVVALMDSSLQNVERLAAMTQIAVEVGTAEQTSADQIRVRANTLRNNINQQKRNIELAKSSLKVLLDVPAKTEITLTQGIDELLSAEAVLALLGKDMNLSRNNDYRLLEKNTELAELGVHAAGWAYGPTVSVAYQYSKQHYFAEGGMRMTPPNLVSVQVSMPLWSSGKRAAGVVEKKIALEEARNTLAETRDNMGILFQQLRYTLQNAYETYVNEQENMEVTGRVFESTTNKFTYGAASNLELVNASNDLISAQSTYVQAVLSLVNAQVELEQFLNE